MKVPTTLFLDTNPEDFYSSEVNIFSQILGLSSIDTIDHNFYVAVRTEIISKLSDQILESCGLECNLLLSKCEI